MRLSTPTRARLSFAPTPLFVAVLAVGAALCVAHGASAAECGGSDNEGMCLDDSTFQWCENGELKTANCPEGQMCVTDNPWYDGAGCVATDDTACGEIPAQGECTTANSVVWCDEGTPRVHPCDEDSICGWDEASGWYDCLPTGNTMGAAPDTSLEPTDAKDDEDDAGPGADDIGPTQDEIDEAGSQAPDEGAPEDTEQAPRAGVPTPTVTTGEGEEGVTPTPVDGGCAGGDTPDPSALMLLCLVWGLSRRRRACSEATA